MLETIAKAKRRAAEKRTRVEEAAKAYDVFLDRLAIPLFRQLANVLRAEGHLFNVFTPGGSVRLSLDRSTEVFGASEYFTEAKKTESRTNSKV